MIFTLAIIEMLTKENLLQGRSIAGTGTIEKDGSVGAIGGIEEERDESSRKSGKARKT